MAATVEKVLHLIEALSRAKSPCGVTQLSKELDLNKSTVYRLLETLGRFGYVRQDDDRHRYFLTTKLWELGAGVLRNLSIHSVAPPYLRGAAEDTGETLILTIPDGDQVLVIDKVDSIQPLQIFSPIGSRVPMYCSSIGKAILVDWSEERIRDLADTIVPHTPRTISTADELLLQVEAVRGRGYAVAIDEWQVGVTGVAAPVRDFTGTIVATIGITGPSSRLSAARIKTLGLKAVEVADQISRALGHRLPDPASAAGPPRPPQPRPGPRATPLAD